MKVTPTPLPGVFIVEPTVYQDSRGFFMESFNQKRWVEHGLGLSFVQDNHSSSIHRTLRGLHAQKKHPQGKLIRVIEGDIFDVAVDIRPTSPTFKKWFGVHLTAENFLQLYVPPGFAHGFLVVSPIAQVEYKVTDFYDPQDEIVILWNDPEIGIEWPEKSPLLSDKDRHGMLIKEALLKHPMQIS